MRRSTLFSRALLGAVGSGRGCGGAGRAGGSGAGPAENMWEPLERRVLMTAYVAETIGGRFGLEHLILDLAAPAGADVVGFGSSAAGLGDIDGDGYGDFAIGASGRRGDGIIAGAPGKVFVYSGRTGQVLRTLMDGFWEFGVSMASAGDVNGDGTPDLLVGSPRYDMDGNPMADAYGAAYIYSGADGSVLRLVTGTGATDELGRSVAAMGDVDGDGTPDFAAGAPGAGIAGEGRVYIFSGATGAVLRQHAGAAAGDRFGVSIASAPAPTGSGGMWLVVGAPLADFRTNDGMTHVDTGIVYVYDGMGVQRSPASSYQDGANMGAAVAVVHSRYGAYVVAGAPSVDQTGPVIADAGAVFTFPLDAGAEPSVYWIAGGTAAGERFGSALANVGDLTGDSSDDIAVRSDGPAGGPVQTLLSVQTYSGVRISVPTGDLDQYGQTMRTSVIPNVIGGAVVGLGDINDDGIPDVLTAGLTAAGAGRATVLPATAIARVESMDGWSDNGRYVFRSLGGYGSGYPSVNYTGAYIIVNGAFKPFSRVPGLDDQFVIGAISDNGTIAGYETTPMTPYDRSHPALIVGGVRTSFRDAVTAINGPTDVNFSGITFRKVGVGGEVLLEESSATTYQPPRTWVLRGGVLTFLWQGYGADINASGVVVGTKLAAFGQIGTSAKWTPAGGVVDLAHFFNLVDINDAGVIIGTDDRGGLATWSPGVGVRSLVQRPLVPVPTQYESWTPVGIDASGQLVARFSYVPAMGYGNVERAYTFDAARGLRELNESVVSGRAPRLMPLQMAGDGDLRYYDGTVLRAVATNAGYVAAQGSPRSASAAADGWTVTLFNQYGTPVALRLTGGQWQGRSLAGLVPPAGSVVDLATYADPKDGKTYAVAVSDRAVTVFRQQADGTFGDPYVLTGQDFPATVITGQLAVFTGTDNKVYITGLNADGELVEFYQTGRFDLDNNRYEVFFENLTRNHLEPQGQTTPQWVGRVVSYVTPWNGLNIAGLDAAGRIQVVWWAPGQDLWSTDDLSTTTLAPVLSGQLAAYVTPWGGLNLAGTDVDGNLSVTWWVPGFGTQWRNNVLTADTGGATLRADSLAAYVTSWGGLNIAGIDTQTGAVNVYWWVPGRAWTSESISVARPEGEPAVTSSLVPLVAGTTLNVFGRGSNGDVVRLFWQPSFGSQWGYENLTELVVV